MSCIKNTQIFTITMHYGVLVSHIKRLMHFAPKLGRESVVLAKLAGEMTGILIA